MSYTIIPLANTDEIDVISLVTGTRVRIGSPFHVTLLQRVRKNENDDEMLQAELDIVRGYLTAINPPPDVIVDAQAIADALARITQDVSGDAANDLVNAALLENSSVVANQGQGALDNRLGPTPR
ncbi:hypothetical protein [Microbacterium sp. SS28]|uniref:hypothetical protein n=1 Tax=Microbacterium sp. SS28 TaxID=2919948 RepID=UPI001FAB0D33|nr:hypothetical protein [Microbacterium sp. SS28]